MKSTVEQLNPVQYRVNVEIEPAEVNQAFETAYKNLQRKARIQGFRPGKAPLGVIRKLYGGQVSGEVNEKLINLHLFSALNEKEIRPIASPMVELKTAPVENQGFNFSAVVDVMPTLELGDYKGVAVSAETYTVKDETLDRELHLLRQRQARTRSIEPGQPAAKGMLAAVSHTATLDGGDVPNMRVDNMTVALGEHELFPDLEAALIGMGIGDKKQVTIKLPADYGDQDLAGKELLFDLTVNDLKHLDVPALDDEFAKDLNFESADKLKENVKAHLEGRAKDLGRQKVETAVLDKIIEAHPFEVPPAMVDQVIDSMIQELQHPNEDARAKALKDQDLRKSMLATAKRRTQNTLVLWHVTQKEKLAVTDQEVKDQVEQAVRSTGLADPKQLARLRKNIEPRVRENMIFAKAMDFLIDNAKVTAVPSEI
jgi:trigger factor